MIKNQRCISSYGTFQCLLSIATLCYLHAAESITHVDYSRPYFPTGAIYSGPYYAVNKQDVVTDLSIKKDNIAKPFIADKIPDINWYKHTRKHPDFPKPKVVNTWNNRPLSASSRSTIEDQVTVLKNAYESNSHLSSNSLESAIDALVKDDMLKDSHPQPTSTSLNLETAIDALSNTADTAKSVTSTDLSATAKSESSRPESLVNQPNENLSSFLNYVQKPSDERGSTDPVDVEPNKPVIINLPSPDKTNPAGAVCLDGSPPLYFFRKGIGSGRNNWMIHFAGGGWCYDIAACLQRSRGKLGSTINVHSIPKLEGMNSANSTINPDFWNWNLVWLYYCDGASFTGDREASVDMSGERIYFRGNRIAQAVFNDLISNHGMDNPTNVLMKGSSAGSLAALYHADRLQTMLPSSSSVKVITDAGFFVDTSSFVRGKNVSNIFENMFNLQNATAGLNSACVAAQGDERAFRCFIPKVSLAFTKASVFALNAAYDLWGLTFFANIDCKFPSITNRMSNNLRRNHIARHKQELKRRSKAKDLVNNFKIDQKKAHMFKTKMATNEKKEKFLKYDNLNREGYFKISPSLSRYAVRGWSPTVNYYKPYYSRASYSLPQKSFKRAKRGVELVKEQRRDMSGFEIFPIHRTFRESRSLLPNYIDDSGEDRDNKLSPKKSQYGNDLLKYFLDKRQKNGSNLFPKAISDHPNKDQRNRLQFIEPKLSSSKRKHLKDRKVHLTQLSNIPGSDTPNITKDDVNNDYNENGYTDIYTTKRRKTDPIQTKLFDFFLAPKASTSTSVRNLVRKESSERKVKMLEKLTNVQNPISRSTIEQPGNRVDKTVNQTVIHSLYELYQNATATSLNNSNFYQINDTKNENKTQIDDFFVTVPNEQVDQKSLMTEEKNTIENFSMSSGPEKPLKLLNKKALLLSKYTSPLLGHKRDSTKIVDLSSKKAERKEDKSDDELNEDVVKRILKLFTTMQSQRSAQDLEREYLTSIRAEPPECTEPQMSRAMRYRSLVLDATKQASGRFIASCIGHSFSLFDETWTGLKVANLSVRDAVGDWVLNRNTERSRDVTDCLDYPCNPTCSY